MEEFKLKKVCRMCGGREFREVLDLGAMPPANSFLAHQRFFKKEVSFPLVVHICQNCKSLQLKHTVSPTILFKNYHYETGASKPLVTHFHNLAEEIASKYLNSPEDLVIEIGSNDGVLLSKIKDRYRVLGVDPASNMAKLARQKGVPTKVGFFDHTLAKEIKSDVGQAKVVVANNVMAHIDDLPSVFRGVKHLLDKDGRFIFEVHWVGNLLTKGGFDQIYHEHLYYHSLHSLQVLLNRLGMSVRDIKLVPIHGESMRVYAGHPGESHPRVSQFLDKEKKMGLNDLKTFEYFAKKVSSNKLKLLELLTKLKKSGKTIVGYGAPAKGNTLLNYFNIGPDILDYVTDTTVSKQGTFAPGSHIPVVSPDTLKKEKPDYILLLSWNYAKAILEKEKELRSQGVKFIIPVLSVKIV